MVYPQARYRRSTSAHHFTVPQHDRDRRMVQQREHAFQGGAFQRRHLAQSAGNDRLFGGFHHDTSGKDRTIFSGKDQGGDFGGGLHRASFSSEASALADKEGAMRNAVIERCGHSLFTLIGSIWQMFLAISARTASLNGRKMACLGGERAMRKRASATRTPCAASHQSPGMPPCKIGRLGFPFVHFTRPLSQLDVNMMITAIVH